ncbi:MAG: type IV pilin protein [Rubrivivax sp.]
MRPPARPCRAHGLSLVEAMVVLAVLGIVAATAWPSHQAQAQRVRRLDATAALTLLQQAQEQHRLRHGRYAADFAALGHRATRSAQGLYDLELHADAPGRVTLAARARDDGAQRDDHDCTEITLVLDEGMADAGPSGRCWSR